MSGTQTRTASPGAVQNATRVVFFVAGFATSAWAPLVPFAKRHAGIDDGSLGLLLLCLGLGSMVAMPFAGALAARLGCRRVIVAAALVAALMLPLLASLSSPVLLAIALALFGAGVGAVDVAMNIQAIMVERDSGRAMMSGFHGLYSVGGIAGAGGMAGLLSLGVPPVLAAAVVLAAVVLAVLVAAPFLLPYGSRSEGPAFAVPHGIVLLIGALAFVLFLAEGAVLDWSAVFLTAVRGVAPSLGGIGYAVFATTMTIGRLLGDRIVSRLGGRRVVLVGGVLAAAGFGLATVGGSWAGALAGFALVGVGCSNIVPVLFTATGRQSAMPESVAVPAITTLGYAGILAGPAGIGLVAHLVGLPAAFAILALMLLAVAATSRALPVDGSLR